MHKISEERKEEILKQLLPPYNRTVLEVSRAEGIGVSTIYSWQKRLRASGTIIGSNKIGMKKEISAEAKLSHVIAAGSLSEAEISEYCREKGIYPEQIKEWRLAFLEGQIPRKQKSRREKAEERKDQQKIRRLERELRRKDKALAEAAALLVLQKKLQSLYGEEEF